MPYITRNEEGDIVSVHIANERGDLEYIDSKHSELIAFITNNSEDVKRNFLTQSDLDLVRVLEDLIDLLNEKHLILFTDLPAAAQEKLLKRKHLRKDMQHSIIDDEENNIF